VPGDDPRRINWKLYGHAPSSELFVREGEPEPPPHSHLAILVDTLADPALYSPAAGRRGVDLLCENALAIALEYRRRGLDLSVGYADGSPIADSTSAPDAELAETLAYPAAHWGDKAGDLPAAPGNRGILVLALPRTLTDTALDRFLQSRRYPDDQSATQTVDLAFLYGDAALEEAAETCARLYRQRAGVHARQILVG
jgi:hypothetical protein